MKRGWYHPKRAASVLLAVGLVCLLLLGRVTHIQYFARQFYVEHGATPPGKERVLCGYRGRILDRVGRPLAQTVVETIVSASPETIQDWAMDGSMVPREDVTETELAKNRRIRKAAKAISASLSLDEDTVVAKLCGTGQHTFIEKRADTEHAEELKQALRAFGCKGIFFQQVARRYYPADRLASAVLGHCKAGKVPGDQFVPASGVEYRYRQITQGQWIAMADKYDSWGRRILSRKMRERPRVRPGKDLILTLDFGTQEIVERLLDECWSHRRPVAANVVVMAARTGEIIAMSCRPNFDPDDIKKILPDNPPPGATGFEHMQNLPVAKPMEPGSSFKILTIAAGLDCGAISEHDTFHCGGTEQIGGAPLKCWGKYATQGHGTLTPQGILAQSCNLGAAKVAQRIGARRLCKFLRKCGIGERPQSGLAPEHPGKLMDPDKMRVRDLACAGFGQGVLVSDLQLTSAICAILNGGKLYQPHIVRGYTDPLTAKTYTVRRRVVRQVCSPQTSRLMRKMVRYAVDEGTGKAARIEGFAIGGKTATAQIYDPDTKRYFRGTHDHLMAFVLAAPVDREPDFVVTVSVERPRVGEHGSDVAAPIARSIADHLLRQPDLFAAEPVETPTDQLDEGREPV